ncbi:MAG: hypothetical protein LH660_16575 [Phormidesmis sp. CAN_BIN36]|nr:hypothetical protein [Phormidesmis sp. CAN_BIN36]
MALQIDLPQIASATRRTFQTIILSESLDSQFEARFLRQTVMMDASGAVLFVINDPDPIVIKSEELRDRLELLSAVMLIQQEVDQRDSDRLTALENQV